MAASSRFAVAVHALAAIASADTFPVTSASLARSVNTNPVVVRRVISRLVRSGLVSARSGKSGGCWLARTPSRITLREVLNAVEDRGLFALHGNAAVRGCPVSRHIKGALSPALVAAQEAAETSLGQVRLSDILRSIRRSSARDGRPGRRA